MKFHIGQRVRIKKAPFRRLVGRLGTVRNHKSGLYEVYLDDWGESSCFRASELEVAVQKVGGIG